MAENGSGGELDAYASAQERIPLGAYAVLTALYNAAAGGALWSAHRRGRLPERVGVSDLLLLGAATHKLTRVLAKDSVTSFARAPFVRYEHEQGRGEVSESARGEGMRRAVGELATCPFCLAQWVAAGLVAGLLHAPRATRTVASVFTVRAVADFLQIAWEIGERRADE